MGYARFRVRINQSINQSINQTLSQAAGRRPCLGSSCASFRRGCRLAERPKRRPRGRRFRFKLAETPPPQKYRALAPNTFQGVMKNS